MGYKHGTIEERFNKSITKTDGCWIWNRHRTSDGYGRIRQSKEQGAQMILSHRLSYEMYVGNIPTGLQVLHKCDNPSCVNPAHLWTGSQEENIKDMLNKQRGVFVSGNLHGMSKLTEEVVRYIRSCGKSLRSLEKETGVSFSAIGRARAGETWKHVQ